MLKSLVLTNKQAEKYSDILSKYDPTAHSALTTESYKSFCREKQENSSSSFSYDSHGFKSEITLDKPQLVFFSVPYSDGWSATVNGKLVDVEKVNYGFMAVEAGSGENEIVFTYAKMTSRATHITTITFQPTRSQLRRNTAKALRKNNGGMQNAFTGKNSQKRCGL